MARTIHTHTHTFANKTYVMYIQIENKKRKQKQKKRMRFLEENEKKKAFLHKTTFKLIHDTVEQHEQRNQLYSTFVHHIEHI